MRDLYTRHASTLPANIQDAIASRYGLDALDSRICDLMTLSEWEDFFDESAPTHADDCYICGGDSPAYRADHKYARACDIIGHQYGTASADHLCYQCGEQATDPAMIDPLWHEHQEHAYRAADFFEQARAARDDIAAGAYPNLMPRLTAPLFRNGETVARVLVRIVGRTIPGAYVVQGIHDESRWIAFTSEIRPHHFF